jgi:microcystin degradation protein MlrC
MAKFRIAIGRVSHETNTFSVLKLRLDDFSPSYGEEIFSVYGVTRTELGGFIDVLRANDVAIVPTIAAAATPSGPIVHEDFDSIVDTITDDLKAVGGVDGVLLSLHGAMVAVNTPDTEGVLLRAVRRTVGDVPIIVTLDLHALVSGMMVENCDAIYGYNTNPHVDSYERGLEAAEAMMKTVKGELHPVVAFKKLRMMPPTINQRTTEGPMVKLFERAYQMEKSPRVLNVSVFGGFPYADVPRVGSSIVVVTDNDRELANSLSDELGGDMWSRRSEFLKTITPIEEAVDRAVSAKSGPVILADVADNPGGGAPGDSTFVLRELLQRHARGVGVATIKDPQAVADAVGVGVGGTVRTKIGGKTDSFHGEPLEVTGVVRTISDGVFVHKFGREGLKENVGRTVVIDVDGAEIILTEKSHSPNDPEIFRRNGIEPTEKRILLLKSRGHFRAAYEPFSKEVIEVDAPGLTTPNLKWFTYHNIPRPIFPLDETYSSTEGKTLSSSV